jgi:putative transposase
MNLVKQIFIKKDNPMYKECDRLCFAAKNLYNYALYQVNAEYKLNGKYLNYNAINRKLIDSNQVDYRALPAKVANNVLIQLDTNFLSYFAALKAYKKDPSLFTGKPEPPKFKNKLKGRFTISYLTQSIFQGKLKQGILKLSGTNIEFKTDIQNIIQVRIVPKKGFYVFEIVYKKEVNEPIITNNYAGIDIGLNNLAAISFNNAPAVIINGRPAKAINQYYNKKLSKLKSNLPHYYDKEGVKKQRGKSNATQKLTNKRNNKIKSYLHKASREVVNNLTKNNISKVVIGKNDGWKNGINLSRPTNQKFVQIPHAQFIQMITYKCQLLGIEVILTNESYTSKCSFLDNEPICKQKTYLGKRVKRGLFRSNKGLLINADSGNGASNILVKVIPKAFSNGIEVVLVTPIIITPQM